MPLQSRITWEKLSVELELLSVENPDSIAPLLVGLNSVLYPSHSLDGIYRQLNFMTYELVAQCEKLNEKDRFHRLNDYFFVQKGFQVLPPQQTKVSENKLLIEEIMLSRNGHFLPLAFIYLHFANQIDLPIYMINSPHCCLLKWIRGAKSDFIQFSNGGELLNQSQLLDLANKTCGIQHRQLDEAYFDILPAHKMLLPYLEKLIQIYQTDTDKLHTTLNVILKIHPAHLTFLGQRALLRKELGLVQDSMADLNRYFSFQEKDQAPPELQMAYFELKTFNDASQAPGLLQ